MGDKATRIEMNEADQVVSATVDHTERKTYCISDENLLALCQIGIYLEHCYQSARDIEWAIHNVGFSGAIHAFSFWNQLMRFVFISILRIQFSFCNHDR